MKILEKVPFCYQKYNLKNSGMFKTETLAVTVVNKKYLLFEIDK
jgi:hypothetical protein